MLRILVVMCLFSCFVQARITVSASPLYPDSEDEIPTQEQDVSQIIKSEPVRVVAPKEKETSAKIKPPAVEIKKKTLLKTKFKNFKRSKKKSRKTATRPI